MRGDINKKEKKGTSVAHITGTTIICVLFDFLAKTFIIQYKQKHSINLCGVTFKSASQIIVINIKFFFF